MQKAVFYSWQSDLPNKTNRGFILEALERATKAIQSDATLAVEPVVDRDTAGVTGSPEIASTILGKITQATVFVPDVSLVTSAEALRQSPNPNVLVELGFAIARLGWDRIVMVMNTAFGEPTSLPFDLRGHRIVAYSYSGTPDHGKADERKRLEKRLTETIAGILREEASIRASEDKTSRAALTQWAQDFQIQRLARLSAGDGPLPMVSNKLACVHVVPCGAVTDTATIDVGDPKTQRTYLAPIGSTGYNTRFNSDGLLRDASGSNGNSDGFLQLFRNGAIESVDSKIMSGQGRREDGLPSIKFMKDLTRFVDGACRMFRELDVRPPVLVLVSFVGMRGASLLVPAEGFGSSAYYATKLDQDQLLLPPVHLVDLDADVRPALRVALDALWQAAGQARCSCYDADGTWINP